jgi:hypothetical protein
LDDCAHPLPLEKQPNFKAHPELTGEEPLTHITVLMS